MSKIKKKEVCLHRVHCDMFGFSILFVVGGTRFEAYKEFAKAIGSNEELVETSSIARATAFWKDSHRCGAIWLSKDDYSLLAHEAVHIAMEVYVLVVQPEKVNRDDEFVPYLTQWICNKYMEWRK